MRNIIEKMSKGTKIDRNSPFPIYLQLREIIKEIVTDSNFTHRYIPKEEELCQIYQVSRDSVAKAISGLVEEGRLYRIKRKGTFINQPEKKENFNSVIDQIGIVWPITNFWDTAISSMNSLARENGYNAKISSYEWHNLDDELKLIEEFKNTSKGITIYPNCMGSDRGFIKKLQETGFPFVLIDLYFPNNSVNCVTADNFNGAFGAVTYLLNHGRKRIVYLGGPVYLSSNQDRMKGYESALKKKNICVDKNLIFSRQLSMKNEDVEILIKKLIKKNKPEAVFCGEHGFANMCFKTANEYSLSIPKDMAIIAFDSIPGDEFLNPPLSVVEQPQEEIGKQAMQLLINSIEGKQKKPKKIFLNTKLIIRESCGKA